MAETAIFDDTGRTKDGETSESNSSDPFGVQFEFSGTKLIHSYKVNISTIAGTGANFTISLAEDSGGDIGADVSDSAVTVAGTALTTGVNTFTLASPKSLAAGASKKFWLIGNFSGSMGFDVGYDGKAGTRSKFLAGSGYINDYTLLVGVWETDAAASPSSSLLLLGVG